MKNNSNTVHKKSVPNFRTNERKTTIIAFFLGVIIIAAAVILGNSFLFFVFFLVLSFVITMLWRKAPRPWISLVSISAATPIAIARHKFNCNLIFALWSVLFNSRNLFRLPKWIYIPSLLVILGVVTSSINWMSNGAINGMMRQGTFAFNIFLGPFLLLPAVYLRMRESQDSTANLQGLLFFLIIPSTVLMISAKLFGNVANLWEASQHASSLSQGYLLYKLGNVYVEFVRTEIGFILAALICASTAIAISHVQSLYRWLAIGCLALNLFMLLFTGSIGSSAACFLGLSAIFFTQIGKVSINKMLTSVVIICITLILSYIFAPQSTKEYLGKRIEHRVTNVDADRFILWRLGMDTFLEHPEGVGFTLKGAGGQFIHNDYIVYAVSYGLSGGLGYAILIVGLLISFKRARKKISKDPAALAVYLAGMGVLVALAFNSITDHSNSNRWYFNVIWSIIWYCYFCSFPEEKKKSAPVPISERGSIESTRSN